MLKRSLLLSLALLLLCLLASLSGAVEGQDVSAEIVAVDPAPGARLDGDDKLYVKVGFNGKIPVRFQALAMRNGLPLEVGAIRNPAALHAPGEGEALAWVFYTNLTHVDAVRVDIFNQEWRKIGEVFKDVDVTWSGDAYERPREVAEWVIPLVRADRRKTDFVYDPSPRRHGFLFDIFFFLNVASLPAYLLLQLHMLYRYRYRWRELAMIPLFPYLIVGFYSFVDLGVERALLITFLFRYTFAAFLWLAVLWLAKRYWQNKLPPPRLYKPPKAD